jgi:hypothetical protein
LRVLRGFWILPLEGVAPVVQQRIRGVYSRRDSSTAVAVRPWPRIMSNESSFSSSLVYATPDAATPDAVDTEFSQILEPYQKQSVDVTFQSNAMYALHSARAEQLAAERRRHNDECLLLTDDNKELRSCLEKTTKQLGVANRQIEMQATGYSRTSFELRREKARAEVNSGSSSRDFVIS